MLLNGKWNCKVTGEHSYEIPGTVPGCVHTDLMDAGLIRDIYYRKNSETIQWIENADVTYERTFTVEDLRDNPYLVFEGLDVYCDIYLNGCKIGFADNMFHAWEYPVGGILQAGENTLTVAFRSPVREVADKPEGIATFTAERIYTRRIQCTYGWDWVYRFVTMGIYKDVRLEYRTPDFLTNVYVYTDNINPYSAQMGVELSFENITLEGWTEFAIFNPQGQEIYRKKRRVLAETVKELVDIPAPQLWYPNGYGEQPLYTLRVTCGSREKTVTFGIRTVQILEIEDAPDCPEAKLAKKLKEHPYMQRWDKNEGSSCFTLLVNNIKIFCKGGNWVPSEPFPSAETPQKQQRLVKLARMAGCNMLRVWGGGIMEQEAFYAACDKEGILVTQDFFMACGKYPEEDDGFIAQLRREAKHTALSIRNHPCLVWWTGDNENAVNGDENQPDYRGRRAALEGLAPVLTKYDPKRRFLPSSPYGGVSYASGVRGTSHHTNFLTFLFAFIREGDLTQYREYFDTFLSRFNAEQPVMGMPYVSSLKKFLTDEDIFGDDETVCEFHSRGNPRIKNPTLYGYMRRLGEGIFGTYTDGADRVKKMQYLQCEWVRQSLELFRRNQWYASGIIYWMYNDCWPASNSWSIVDYYAMPKPAYYSFKRCAAPVIGSITQENGKFSLYISNNGLNSAAGTCRVYLYNILTGQEKTIAEAAVNSPANETVVVTSWDALEATPEELILCDITTDLGTDRCFYLLHNWDKMPWQPEKYAVEKKDNSIAVTAETTIPMVLLDEDCVLSDNSFFLKIGESRTVTAEKE